MLIVKQWPGVSQQPLSPSRLLCNPLSPYMDASQHYVGVRQWVRARHCGKRDFLSQRIKMGSQAIVALPRAPCQIRVLMYKVGFRCNVYADVTWWWWCRESECINKLTADTFINLGRTSPWLSFVFLTQIGEVQIRRSWKFVQSLYWQVAPLCGLLGKSPGLLMVSLNLNE